MWPCTSHIPSFIFMVSKTSALTQITDFHISAIFPLPHFWGLFCILSVRFIFLKKCLLIHNAKLCNHRIVQTTCMSVWREKVVFFSFECLVVDGGRKHKYLLIKCNLVFCLSFQNFCSCSLSPKWDWCHAPTDTQLVPESASDSFSSLWSPPHTSMGDPNNTITPQSFTFHGYSGDCRRSWDSTVIPLEMEFGGKGVLFSAPQADPHYVLSSHVPLLLS